MIEITRHACPDTGGNGAYTFRISPTDPLLIERRENKHGARWCFYMVCDSANDAKRALMQIGKEDLVDSDAL